MDETILIKCFADNTLLDIVIGGIIGLLSSLLLEYFRNKKAEKFRLLQKKKTLM